MKVHVDARCLQDPNYAYRGVGHHTATVLADLRVELPRAEEVTAILDPALPPLAPERARLFDRVAYAALPPEGGTGALFVQPSPMTHDQDMLAPLLKLRRVYRAAILYDFIPLEDPGRYLRETAARRAYYTALVSLRGYDRYLSISAHTAREAERLAGIAGSAIAVTGVAVRDAFAAAAPAATAPAGAPYFFVVGGDDPRKNVECAVRAHGALSRRGDPRTALWILGHYGRVSTWRLRAAHAEAGGRRDALRFLSGVSDAELAALYRGAIANLCPSRTEGFSIPVVEAVAAGCPVLVSSCPSQLELMPMREVRFDPDDPGRLAELMAGLLAPEARRTLLEQQRPFAARFARAEVSRRFWGAVTAGLDAWRPPPVRAPRSRPRVAICSPYPPVRSGVADYTAQTIRALARHADVDVLSTQETFLPDPSVRRFRHLTALPYVLDEYDRIVSVVGNSIFHTRIVELLVRYGGPCISHDNRLAELYYHWRGAVAFNDLARRFLGRRVPLGESERWVRQPERLPTLFFEDVLPRCEPFVVHSRPLQQELARRYGRQISYLPFCVYRAVETGELTAVARRAARARLGIPPDRLVVVTLGIVDAVKAPEECVDAIRLLVRGGVPAHLYFVGSADRIGRHLRARAARAGVADHVHLLDGWHGEDVYRDFLRAADLGIQLRTHGFGGLSGAALDCIAYGIPTVMNADLARAMDAPGYVAAVDDRIAPTDIAERLGAAYAAGVHQERATPARAEYVAAHDFDVYARGLLELLGLPAQT